MGSGGRGVPTRGGPAVASRTASVGPWCGAGDPLRRCAACADCRGACVVDGSVEREGLLLPLRGAAAFSMRRCLLSPLPCLCAAALAVRCCLRCALIPSQRCCLLSAASFSMIFSLLCAAGLGRGALRKESLSRVPADFAARSAGACRGSRRAAGAGLPAPSPASRNSPRQSATVCNSPMAQQSAIVRANRDRASDAHRRGRRCCRLPRAIETADSAADGMTRCLFTAAIRIATPAPSPPPPLCQRPIGTALQSLAPVIRISIPNDTSFARCPCRPGSPYVCAFNPLQLCFAQPPTRWTPLSSLQSIPSHRLWASCTQVSDAAKQVVPPSQALLVRSGPPAAGVAVVRPPQQRLSSASGFQVPASRRSSRSDCLQLHEVMSLCIHLGICRHRPPIQRIPGALSPT